MGGAAKSPWREFEHKFAALTTASGENGVGGMSPRPHKRLGSPSSSSSAASPPSTGGRVNGLLLLLVFAMFGLNVYQNTNVVGASMQTEQSTFTLPTLAEEVKDDEATLIIRRSYEKSYAHILPCPKSTLTGKEYMTGKECMKTTRDYFNTPGIGNSTKPSIPWWFQTLLRDTQNNGAYGHWHHFYTSSPPLNFCTIEKVATTEWRKVFCKLNADECAKPGRCGKLNCMWRTQKKMPDDAPWAVFLRDPLERLLSGFLDKCYKENVRRLQRHCAPKEVFVPGNKTDKSVPALLDDLHDKEKQFFAAYVDVLPLKVSDVGEVFLLDKLTCAITKCNQRSPPPLPENLEKWNVHFLPQAIVCGLHKTIGTYDFVGNMGGDFASDLDRMAGRFGGPLPAILNETFDYERRLGGTNTGKGNRHSTNAPEKVQRFYTAQTVRRGLELLSIDYMLLGLEVPEWARQMLRDDVA